MTIERAKELIVLDAVCTDHFNKKNCVDAMCGNCQFNVPSNEYKQAVEMVSRRFEKLCRSQPDPLYATIEEIIDMTE